MRLSSAAKATALAHILGKLADRDAKLIPSWAAIALGGSATDGIVAALTTVDGDIPLVTLLGAARMIIGEAARAPFADVWGPFGCDRAHRVIRTMLEIVMPGRGVDVDYLERELHGDLKIAGALAIALEVDGLIESVPCT